MRESRLKKAVELGVGLGMVVAVIGVYGIVAPAMIITLKVVDTTRRTTALGLDVLGEIFPTARDLAKVVDPD